MDTTPVINVSDDRFNISTVEDDPIGYYPKTWTIWILFIATPVIVAVGIVGNTFSLLVMKSKSLRRKSYSHYLCALAVFDSFTLIMRLINTVDQYKRDELQQFGIFHDFSDISCKIYNFLEHISYLMSAWLVVLMAVERFVAVSMPFKKTFIRKQSGSIVAIFLLLILLGVSQVFRIVMLEFDEHDRACVAQYEYIALYTSLNVYLYQLTLAFALPLVIVLLCNLLIIYQIFKIRKAARCKGSPSSRYPRVVNRRHRTTCMLLIVSFTFIATQLPLFTIILILEISIKLENSDAWGLFTSLLPYQYICITISLINYAVNFFIYILSGRSFRFELRKIFVSERNASYNGTRTREEFIRL